jgi:hypothetical protein
MRSGGASSHLVQRLGAGSRLAAHMPRLLLFKNRAQIAPNGGIIID